MYILGKEVWSYKKAIQVKAIDWAYKLMNAFPILFLLDKKKNQYIFFS